MEGIREGGLFNQKDLGDTRILCCTGEVRGAAEGGQVLCFAPGPGLALGGLPVGL